MKNYCSLFIGLITLVNSSYATATRREQRTNDNFRLGKIVAINETALKKKTGFTQLTTLPSWDPGFGAEAWLTKPGAKVIVPRTDGRLTYGIVLSFKRPVITVLINKRPDGSYQTKDFRIDKLGTSLKWIHRSWINKKRKRISMDKELAFVNYNHVTKNFEPFAL